MEFPNFSNAEFINQTIWNTGVTQLISGIHAFPGNSVFFQPGLLFPNDASFIFPGTLFVTVNIPLPFRVLFGSGAYCGAHGNIDGQDTTSYSVNFTSFVPISGSQTVYLGITYGTVQQNPYVIVGPPVGHPDYSAEFVPYVAYSSIEETLILTLTLTPPDNETVVELGRVILTSGQTSITSIDTTHQQLASLIVNTLPLFGDVTGPFSANLISKLQGKPVSASNPSANSFLQFNGTNWVASPISNLSGDVTGPITNNIVTKIRSVLVTSNTPGDGQVLTFISGNNDIEWRSPSTSISGDVTGSLSASEVVGIRTIPVTATAPTDGQVLTFVAVDSKLEWMPPPVALGQVFTQTLNSSVTLNSTSPTPVLSQTITFPTGNSWRVIVTYTVAINMPQNGSNPQRMVTLVRDSIGNQFGEQMQNPVGSGTPTGFSNGFDVSPFYNPAVHPTVTFQLLASASTDGGTPHAEPSNTTQGVTIPTEISFILIPASN